MGFSLKQFNIDDDRSSMKVGTDAVLIGSWAGSSMPSRILDVGTGCGIIALMMAQRFPEAAIDAIDIHKPSVEQADENFRKSPWSKRLRAIHTSLQEYDVKDYTYDLIVSNPPFFVNSLLPPGHSKSMAKHTTTLSFTELFAACRLLTKPAGNFCIIGPHDSLLRMRRHAALNGLCLSRKLEIIPVIGKKANRVLTEWSFTQHTEATDKLPIRTPDGQYTDAYRQLTCDFYLAL